VQADSDGEGRTHLRKRLKFARSECEVREATRSDGRTALCAHWHGAHWHGAHRHGAARRALARRGARADAPAVGTLSTRAPSGRHARTQMGGSLHGLGHARLCRPAGRRV
jgi:hypothetical protein